MPNLRELLARAAPEPSAEWDATEVARRGRSLRRRRRLAAGAAGVGVLVAVAVAAPALLDQRDTELRLGPAEDGPADQSRVDESRVDELDERHVEAHEAAPPGR